VDSERALARKPLPVILLLSAFIAGFLLWLIYFKGRTAAAAWTGYLSGANAVFNSLSALCLICGYVNIRRGKRIVHMRFMLSATVFSTLFLLSYITYHYFHGATRFAGQGLVRPLYFTILTTHTILAVVIVPLILVTLYRAARGDFIRHRRIARWTLPLWLYVSVTGVIVYLMLYQIYPS